MTLRSDFIADADGASILSGLRRARVPPEVEANSRGVPPPLSLTMSLAPRFASQPGARHTCTLEVARGAQGYALPEKHTRQRAARNVARVEDLELRRAFVAVPPERHHVAIVLATAPARGAKGASL